MDRSGALRILAEFIIPVLFRLDQPLPGPNHTLLASLVAQMVKNLRAVQETQVRFLGRGDSPREGNGNPLQYSRLENPMDRGAWQATVHGVTRVRHDLVSKPPSPNDCGKAR